MTVDRPRRRTAASHDGNTVYFCSAHCKKRFDEDPEQYVGRGEAQVLAHAGDHGQHGYGYCVRGASS